MLSLEGDNRSEIPESTLRAAVQVIYESTPNPEVFRMFGRTMSIRLARGDFGEFQETPNDSVSSPSHSLELQGEFDLSLPEQT